MGEESSSPSDPYLHDPPMGDVPIFCKRCPLRPKGLGEGHAVDYRLTSDDHHRNCFLCTPGFWCKWFLSLQIQKLDISLVVLYFPLLGDYCGAFSF